MIVGQLQVAQIDALKGRQERHGGGGGATNLNDAGGRAFYGVVFVVGGPHRAQRRGPVGQMVGAGAADAHLGVEEDGELVGKLSGRRAGDDLGRSGGNGSDVIVGDRDV